MEVTQSQYTNEKECQQEQDLPRRYKNMSKQQRIHFQSAFLFWLWVNAGGISCYTVGVLCTTIGFHGTVAVV